MRYVNDALKILGAVALSVLLGLAVAVLVGGCACAPRPTPERALLSRLAKSSVKIVDENGGIGSGTVVKVEKGKSFILTAAHVVEDCDTLYVLALRGIGKAKIVKIDAREDLALLVVSDDLRAPALPIARRDPERYERAWVMGSFDGMPRTAGTGIVANAGFPLPLKRHAVYEVVIPIYQGDSGGTLANAAGELVGVPVEEPQDYFSVEAALTNPATGDRATLPLPLRAVVPVPGVGYFVGVWGIRDFLRGTEVLP